MKQISVCLIFACVLLMPWQGAAASDAALLKGLWMETANYPASSVLRFERSGDALVGKYRQVSTPQQHWGFAVGETVIRGRLKGKVYSGEVLLKLHKEFVARCGAKSQAWVPIELNLVEPGKLYGRWLQTHFSADDPCLVVGHSWQLYGLERLKLD